MVTLILKYNTAEFSLRDEKKVKLRKFVEDLSAVYPKFIISGYSDSADDHELNWALSKARANTVSNFLKSTGISSERIINRSFGERFFSGNERNNQVKKRVLVEAIF